MNYMPSPLLPYMTVTNEPGIYKEGRHGIRIENTQVILPYRETEFGTFLQFDPLTLCPIDMEPIDWSLNTAHGSAKRPGHTNTQNHLKNHKIWH